MFNCVVYGESGSGKTPLSATLEECEATSPCLFMDVDMGAMSINIEKPPTVLEIDTWEKMQDVYIYLLRATKGLDSKGPDLIAWEELASYISGLMNINVPVLQYKSVVIDSGTELEYVCRSVVITEEKSKKPEHDPEAPEQRDYLKTGERMKKMWRKFRDLPLAVVMTAGVRDLKDDRDGSLRHFPAFQPGFSKDLVRMTDLIMYMSVDVKNKTWYRTLQTHLSQRIIARDRSQQLEPFMTQETFHFRNIVEKVAKGVKRNS